MALIKSQRISLFQNMLSGLIQKTLKKICGFNILTRSC